MITKIGAKPIEKLGDFYKVTHLIGNTPLRRTPKVMGGMSRTSQIVRLEWLTQSAACNEVIPCTNYLINNKAAKKRYGFVVRESLANRNAARELGGILANQEIYICTGVSGKKDGSPKLSEIKMLVKLAGGISSSLYHKIYPKIVLRFLLLPRIQPTQSPSSCSCWFIMVLYGLLWRRSLMYLYNKVLSCSVDGSPSKIPFPDKMVRFPKSRTQPFSME